MKQRSVAALFLICLFMAQAGAAQVGTDGSILGTVRDSSGAVIPGADVTIKNLETGLTKTAVTDQDGYFEILALPRGTYSAAVALTSFKTWRQQPIELTVGELKRIEPVLAVGDMSQEVTVEGGAELVQTEKASMEGAVEQRQIRDLPINGRNPIAFVNLVPGMKFQGIGASTFAREHVVQGLGQRDNQTRFTVDGIDSNDPSSDRGIAFPNIDTVAQVSVLTSNFSAESGKNPLQVQLVTKGGTNEFHGTLWEFLRNDALDARNAFALTRPKLIQNQYGYSLGGPVLRNRTFFFSSYEGTKNRAERIYNAATIAPEMLNGDFSSLTRNVNDPLTPGVRFPGNVIPANRISPASKFLSSYVLLPNSPGNRFRAIAPALSDHDNLTFRVDQQLTATQRLYVRWLRIGQNSTNLLYRPDYTQSIDLAQHSTGLVYNWSISPKTLLDVAAGFLHSNQVQASPQIGKDNQTDQAGIQGFATAGRAEAVGLPTVTITGYQGFGLPNNTPGSFKREDINAKMSMNLVRSKHSLGFGYEYNDRRTLTRHSSSSSRGEFGFNGQYTGDGFADYLLGLVQTANRNFPLKSFGFGHSPYSGLYAQDFWRLHPNLTFSAGLRYDFWHEKTYVRNNGATFDLKRGKAVASVGDDGKVDLTSQATAPFLAKATEGMWITATEAGIPGGLFEASGYFSPRLGISWRPWGKADWVFRGGYGIFPTSFDGNVVGSSIIGFPYWTIERQTFAVASRQRWETAYTPDPERFTNPSITAVTFDAKPMKIHQWNVSLQKSLPFLQSALTLSYVGNIGRDLITQESHNEVAPGTYTNLQAARPYPTLGTVRLYDNVGRSSYHSMQLKYERRFTRGLSYMFGYVFARNMDEYGASLTDNPTPFAPKGYDRGRSQLENRHIATWNSIWELPFGRGRRFGSGIHPALNVILGGWEFSNIYGFASGGPLTLIVGGATLGNGLNTRPNLVGDPHVDDPTVARWFDTTAFVAPAARVFGNAGVGVIEGPGNHSLDTALLKNFHFSESRYVQLRWEMFNATNHVNLNDPGLTLNTATFGVITGAGPARQMQFALKIVF
jgi:outer membrane receptor protein involved in Fe transport